MSDNLSTDITPPVSPVANGEIDGVQLLTGDPFEPIKQKFGGDINKLAEGYKNLQSHADKIASKFKKPDSYAVKDEYKELIGEANLKSLTAVADSGEFSQKQFDAMLDSIYGFQKTVKEKQSTTKAARDELLKDNADKIKAFYADRLPEEVLNTLIENGRPEDLKTLIDFRERSLTSKKTPNPGARMTDTTTLNPQKLIAEKRAALQQVSSKIHKANITDQQSLLQERNQLANEIAELLKTSS